MKVSNRSARTAAREACGTVVLDSAEWLADREAGEDTVIGDLAHFGDSPVPEGFHVVKDSNTAALLPKYRCEEQEAARELETERILVNACASHRPGTPEREVQDALFGRVAQLLDAELGALEGGELLAKLHAVSIVRGSEGEIVKVDHLDPATRLSEVANTVGPALVMSPVIRKVIEKHERRLAVWQKERMGPMATAVDAAVPAKVVASVCRELGLPAPRPPKKSTKKAAPRNRKVTGVKASARKGRPGTTGEVATRRSSKGAKANAAKAVRGGNSRKGGRRSTKKATPVTV